MYINLTPATIVLLLSYIHSVHVSTSLVKFSTVQKLLMFTEFPRTGLVQRSVTVFGHHDGNSDVDSVLSHCGIRHLKNSIVDIE